MIRRYEPSDYAEMQSWYLGRKLIAPPEWSLSESGFFVPSKAAGFLYTTNSGLCYLDQFITNVNAHDRLEAVSSIVSACLDLASSLNFKGVFAGTTHDSLIALCERYGMVPVKDCTILGKGL